MERTFEQVKEGPGPVATRPKAEAQRKGHLRPSICILKAFIQGLSSQAADTDLSGSWPLLVLKLRSNNNH